MESSYITALETKADWLKWGIQNINLNTGMVNYLRILQSSDTYFMNRRFSALVDNARSTVPDDLEFESSWMLSPEGWLWIEEPFVVPSPIEMEEKKRKLTIPPVRISAVGWLSVPEGTPTADYMDTNKAGRVAKKGAFQFLCFLDFSNFRDDEVVETTEGRIQLNRIHKNGFGTWSYFMLQDGDKLIDRITQFEKQAKLEGGAYNETRQRDMLHEIRWVYSAMYLMAQRLRVTVHHDTDRATKRRGIRENKPVENFIKVISLRRYEEEKKQALTTGKSVDWQWQWTVRGHWRNQFYRSTGEYKPKFIESFIKGPADKPLKPDSVHVFVARR